MDLFSGAELAFGESYFIPRNPNIIKITTDLPVKTVVSAEVGKSAGSFAFAEIGLQNRFIIWRADGTNLHLNEFSIDKDLIDSSLCFNFSHSLIIPGTRLFVVRHKIFLIIVPTQSGIHRFYIHLDRNQDDSLGNLSILSRLHQSGELYATHDFNAWKSPGIATSLSVGTDQNGSTKAVVRMLDGPVLRIIYPSISPMATAIAEEYLLQDVGMLASLFKKQPIGIFDAAVVTSDSGELRILSVSHDGKLRVLDASSGNILSVFDLIGQTPGFTCRQIEDISLRVVQPSHGQIGKSEFLLVHLLLSGGSHFFLLKQNGKNINVCFSTSLNYIYIKDFTARIISSNLSNNKQENYCIWVIVNEPPEIWDSDEELQPYTLMKCEYNSYLATSENQVWESVRPASSSCTADNRLFKYQNSEGIKNRIFDGNNYSFDVVSRAVQIVCKQPQHGIEYGNWIALSRLLDDFLSSGQLKQLYLVDIGDPIDDTELLHDETKIKQAYEKFWADFLKTCDQLQEESLEPLAFWQSGSTGLIGVIQKCRFTTYLPPDDQMQAICKPTNIIAKLIFDIVRPSNPSKLSNPNKTSELVNNNSDEVCRLISSFGSRASPLLTKNPCNLVKFRSHFLQSNFTVALIAMAFRTIVLARLKIACLINSLVDVIPQILLISSEDRLDPKLAMVISTYNSRVAQSINYYTTLWIALSVRLVSHDNIPKQINVAQAFLKYGVNDKFVMTQRPMSREDEDIIDNGTIANRIVDNQMMEDDLEDPEIIENDQFDGLVEDEQFDDGEYITHADDISYSSIIPNMHLLPPPSRWDDTVIKKSRTKQEQQQQQNQQSSFGRFFADLIEGMLNVLWPESHTLTLPCFLAESNFFDALKNYCSLNEPFPSELNYSFQFLQAIACSGQNKPETAWTLFQEISKGIENGDEVLNKLLCNLYPSPSVNLLTNNEQRQNNNNFPIDERTVKNNNNKHSLIEYYNKIMFIFKEHKHSEYVILAGSMAVRHANGDRDELLLSEVYATLFTQHLLTKTYWEAVRAVLQNPNKKRQSVCLYQLITHLLDTQQTKILVALPYGELAEMVVEILEARCKAEMVGSGTGSYSMYNIAYAFHISRCEYIKAAKLMYELSIRLRSEIQDQALLQRRCNTLATIFQTMQICENNKNDGVLIVLDDIEEKQNIDREKSPEEIDEEFEFVDTDGNISEPNKKQLLITKADISRELLKIEARLALIDADPTIVPPLEEAGILYESLRYKRYDMAWLLIKEYGLKPNDLLAQITEEAIRIDNELNNEYIKKEINESDRQEEEEKLPEWVFCNSNFIRDLSIGGNQKPHWRIVISYLDLSLKLSPHDSSILRTVANVFLKFSIKLPGWLVQRYSEINFGDLLRLLIDYGDLSDAFSILLVQIETIKKHLNEKTAQQIIINPLTKSSEGPDEILSLLPLVHIEMLFQIAEKDENRMNLPIAETTTKLKEFYAYHRAISRNPVKNIS
uniref:Nuclear pore complex protein Nup160 homolog n=2 Tax=Meloidogyne incognita group TaxID=654580 RepID=A0A914L7G2_MELIC